MKILLCHNFYRTPGGEDRVFRDEAALLEAGGHEVVRFTMSNRDVEERPRAAVALGSIWNRESARWLGRLLDRERPDVFHATNLFPLFSPSVYDVARARGVPVVQSVHNFRWQCANANFVREGLPCELCLGKTLPWQSVVHRCYHGNLVQSAVVGAMQVIHNLRGTIRRRVDRVIALSEASRDKLVEGGWPAERIAVKPNFLAPDPGPGSGPGVDSETRTGTDARTGGRGYALFVGRLVPAKGVQVLLAAWRDGAPGMPLKIVGDGPLADEVRSAAEADPAIEVLGPLDLAPVLDLMGEAACLVVPSIAHENCPRVIIEALAKGTPVVASDSGALAELVDDEIGARFEPESPTALAAAVRLLSADPQGLAARRAAARRRFEDLYTGGRNLRILTEIYRHAGAERA